MNANDNRDYIGARQFSDRQLNRAKALLGLVLFTAANNDEDINRNTDLMLRQPGGHRISHRMRSSEYFERYPMDFLIRCHRSMTNRTEIHKLMAGWGDYLFFCFANEDNTNFLQWFVGDLNILREYIFRYILTRPANDWPGQRVANKDDGTEARAISILHLPPEFIIGASHNLKKRIGHRYENRRQYPLFI